MKQIIDKLPLFTIVATVGSSIFANLMAAHATNPTPAPTPTPTPTSNPYNQVTWTASTSKDFARYEVHRSIDKASFTPIFHPDAKIGSSTRIAVLPTVTPTASPIATGQPTPVPTMYNDFNQVDDQHNYFYKVLVFDQSATMDPSSSMYHDPSISSEVAAMRKDKVAFTFTFSPRTCAIAGAVLNDPWHTIPILITIKKSGGGPIEQDKFSFRIDNNLPASDTAQNHGAKLINVVDTAAQFNATPQTFKAAQPGDLISLVTGRTVDANNNLVIRVLSGNTVTANAFDGPSLAALPPSLVIMWTNGSPPPKSGAATPEDIGSIPLKFLAVQAKRRYGLQEYYNEGYPEDDGWDFYQPSGTSSSQRAVFTGPRQIIKAQLSLKVRIPVNPTDQIDQTYFAPASPNPVSIGNPPRLYSMQAKPSLSDALDWQPVASHFVQVKVSGFVRENLQMGQGTDKSGRPTPNQPLQGVPTAFYVVRSSAGSFNSADQARVKFYAIPTNAAGEPYLTDGSGHVQFEDLLGERLPLDASGNPVDPVTGVIRNDALPIFVSNGAFQLDTYVYPLWIPLWTKDDGTGIVYFKSGSLVNEAMSISLSEVDQTQWSPP